MTEEAKNPEQATEGQAAAVSPAQAPATFRAILGRKLEMTQLFDNEGQRRPVTVVRAGPCPVLRVKSRDGKDGYSAVLIGFGDRKERNTPKSLLGQFKAAGTAPLRHQREFRVADVSGLAAGMIVDVGGRFAPGDYVDVQGTSKGKGFAGVMKRHNFRGLPASHGASDKQRSPGSLTSRRSLGRVLPGQRMAGHLGAETVTIQKLEVLKVDPEQHLLYIQGSVPGPAGSLIVVMETVKGLKKRPAPVKKSTVKRDKMGNIIADAKKAKKK